MSELPGFYIHDPEVCRVTATIMLAPPHHGVTIESQLAAVRRIAAPVTPVSRDGMLKATFDRHLVQVRDTWVHQTTRRLEQNFLAVGAPADDDVGCRIEGKLFRDAAFGGYDKDIIVSVAVGRERDPLPVGRKARVDVARLVHGQPLRIAAVFVCHPDVALIAESDFAIVIARL